MIMYRGMTEGEYKKILCGEDVPVTIYYYKREVNTFNYAEKVPYMHFFRYLEHAREYTHMFGNLIVKCDIPDDLIEETGYGFYSYFYPYFYPYFWPYKNSDVTAPIPEIIIKRSSFSSKYIMGKINRCKKNGTPCISGVKEVKLYHSILKKLYVEWKNNNPNIDDEFDFCYYALEYFNDRDLDNILNEACEDYLKKERKMRLKKR